MKRICALALCGALLLSPALAAGEAGFSDVPAGSWYEQDAAYCRELGLMKGTGADTFSPDGTVSDGEVLTVAARFHNHYQGGGWDLPQAPDNWGTGKIFVKNNVKLFSFTISDFGVSTDWKFEGAVFSLYIQVDEKTSHALTPAGSEGAEAELELNGVRLTGGTLSPCPKAPLGLTLKEGPLMALTLPVTPELKAAEAAFQRAAGPEIWCRDALYHLEHNGLLDGPGSYSEADQVSSAATRMELAQWLGRVMPQEALSPINVVEQLPDTASGDVLALYRAGILTGSDAYGTFHGGRGLTRAELCAVLSRCADPARRVQSTFQEPVYQDYDLTPLLPGYTVQGEVMIAPDRMYLDRYSGDGRLMDSGILWSDGSFHPLELSRYQWSFLPGKTLIRLTDPKTGQQGILDAQDGSMPIPLGSYQRCDITGDGHILFQAGPDADLQLLDATGVPTATLPAPDARWDLYAEGLAPRQDPESKLWGYTDLSGAWVLPPKWEKTTGFCDGYAVVSDRAGMGVIDRAGTLVIPCQHDFLRPIGGGYYYDAKDGAGGLIGVNGTASPANPYLWDGAICSNGYISSYDRILDPSGQPVTPAFDASTSSSVGSVEEDGSAFVILDRKVYWLTFRGE